MSLLLRMCYRSVLIFISVLLAASLLQASEFQTGKSIHISNLHHIEDDLYAWAETITIDGTIQNDLVAGAYTVDINGQVNGSENIFAYKFDHTGIAGNSLRAFANTIDINGRIAGSALLMGNSIHIGKGAEIKRDLTVTGNFIRIDGLVGGDVIINGSKTIISGEIIGNVSVEGDELRIVPPAVIRGDLRTCCIEDILIDTASGVTIMGEIVCEQAADKTEKEDESSGVISTAAMSTARILAAFLFGIIALLLFRRWTTESLDQLRSRFSVSIAAGFLLLLVAGTAIVVLVIALILLLAGLVIVSGNLAPLGTLVLTLSILIVPISSFVAVSSGVILYSGKVIFAFLVGHLLVRLINPNAAVLGKGQLLLGLIVLALLFAAPLIGILIYLLVSIAGAGAIVLAIRKSRRQNNQTPRQNAAPSGQVSN
ncbi:MAG: hypothetical protein ABII79_12960 [bacterium]